MICSLMNYKIPYGVVKFGVNGIIEEMQEKPTVSYFTNTGCYILEPEVFEAIPENVEIGMPQILERLQSEGLKVCAYPISENAWLDMGEMDSLERMTDKLENENMK